LRQAANGIEIVAIQRDGFAISINGLLVILLLLVGVTEDRVEPGRTGGIWNLAQNISGASRVAF